MSGQFASSTAPSTVREFLADHVPRRGTAPLDDTLDLTADLGLDSVALVELLIACEDRFGVPCPAALFEDGALTVGRLVTHIVGAASPAR